MAFISSKNSSDSSVESSNYTPSSQKSGNQGLLMGLWLVRHKPALYRGTKWFLIVVCVMLWGYSIIGWGGYMWYQVRNRPLFESSLVTFSDFSTGASVAPLNLQVQGADVFQSGVGKYDVVADVTNPNDRFLVQFDYYFVVDGVKTALQKTFLLPGERRPVVLFGVTSENNSFGAPTVRFESMRWQRFDPKQYSNPRRFQDVRLQFEVSSTTFARSETTMGAAHILEFDVKNNSAYNYHSPLFYVGLYTQGGLSGVMLKQTDDFRSQELKHFELRSFAPNLSVTEVRIFPIINVYDDEVYLRQ